MFCLTTIGDSLLYGITARHFLSLYIAGGIGCSLLSSLNRFYLQPRLRPLSGEAKKEYEERSMIGASGAFYAILTARALMARGSRVKVFGLVPCRWRTFLVILICYDTLGVLAGNDLVGGALGGRADNAGHLGGAVVGAIFWKWVLKGKRLNLP